MCSRIKFPGVLLLLLPGLFCTTYYVEEPARISEPNRDLLQSKRIALVGFLPFRRRRGLAYNTIEAVLDEKRPTYRGISVGKPITEFPARGVDNSISREKVKAFISNYLGQVLRSGLPEMKKMFVIRYDPEIRKARPYVRKRDVDYYVVAVHGPPFGKMSDLGRLSCILTIIPYGMTFGAFPLLKDTEVVSTFDVFDAQLNHLERRTFKEVVRTAESWWGEHHTTGFFSKDTIGFDHKPFVRARYRAYQRTVRLFSNQFAESIRGKAD